ncbi:mucin-5AC-like [Sycon ciliatum]|uniref:mucin-5AC-like n=1 Tax=Sycon ciliatum TaxID=27933 RepID=UPI0031F6AD06
MAERRLSTSFLSVVSVWCVLMLTATGQQTFSPVLGCGTPRNPTLLSGERYATSLSSSGSSSLGSVRMYQCPTSFIIKGSQPAMNTSTSSIRCRLSGSWTGPVPLCTALSSPTVAATTQSTTQQTTPTATATATAQTTQVSTTSPPTLQAATTVAQTTQRQTTAGGMTTQPSTTLARTTQPSTTQAPTTQAPTTQAPTSLALTTRVSTVHVSTTRTTQPRTSRAPRTTRTRTATAQTSRPGTGTRASSLASSASSSLPTSASTLAVQTSVGVVGPAASSGNTLAIGVGAGVGGVLLVLVIIIILIVLIRGRTGGGNESAVAGGKSTSPSIRSNFSSIQAGDNYDQVVLSNYSTEREEEEEGKRPLKKALSSQPTLEIVESTFSRGSQEVRSGSAGDKIAATILYHDIGPASVEKNTPYYSRMAEVRGTASAETTSNPSALMGAPAYEEMAPIGKKEEQNSSQVAASVPPALVGAYVYEEMAPLGKEEQNAIDAAVSSALMGAPAYEEMAPLGKKEKHDASQVADSVSPALVGAYVYEEMAPLGKEEQNAIDAAVSPALMGVSMYEDMAPSGKKEEQDTTQVAAPTSTNRYQPLGPAGATEQYQSVTPVQAERVPTKSMTSSKPTSVYEEAAPASRIEQYETLIPDVQRKNMDNRTPNSTPMPGNTATVYQRVGDGSQKEQYQSLMPDVRRSVTDSTSSSVPTASTVYQDLNVMSKQGQYQSPTHPRLRKPSHDQAGSSSPPASGGASDRLPRSTQSKQVSGQTQRSKLAQDTREVRAVSLSSATNQPPNRGSCVQGNASPANPGSTVYQALGTEPQEHLYESSIVPKPSNTTQEAGLAAAPTGDYQAILAAYVQTSDYEQPQKHEKSPS